MDAMKRHCQMFAAYNRWANERLYGAAEKVPPEAWRRDVGAFFGSLRGALNHILVADRIWMRRFTGTGDAPARLDTVLHDDLAGLARARGQEDRRIADWIETLSPADMSGSFTYTTVTDARTVTQALAPALAHLFNHQTHHRGQAHTILSLLGEEPPSLDLIYFQRQEPRWQG